MCKMALTLIITTEKLRWIKKKIAVGCLFLIVKKASLALAKGEEKTDQKARALFGLKKRLR